MEQVTYQSNQQNQKIRYKKNPDYTKPLVEVPFEVRNKIFDRLFLLYDEEERARVYLSQIERLIKVHCAHKTEEMIEWEKNFDASQRFSQKDMVLITYGDLLRGNEKSPLATLAHFLDSTPSIKKVINTLHILPFFPYTSDKGFSITDFRIVDPNLGSWQDIEAIGSHYKLMFDAVFNHISSKSLAFLEMLNGNLDYKDIATVYSSPDQLTDEQRKLIVRPRTSDILTKFDSIKGPIWVWTTFSPDQIDLNYHNPRVLMNVIETLLLYVRHGADLVRLDAVTYLWEEPGTSCAHLNQTHETIKLFRDILDIAAPYVALITETNVPHEENISYFGSGKDEAQMVYNFALPPLVLHTFYREDVTALANWAKKLQYPSLTTTFFNMLDTHDGVGLMGVKNILSQEDIDFIIHTAKEHGALISYKTGANGAEEPYEINTTWFSALNMDNNDEDISFQVKRFVASRSIALVLRGVPGIYFHSLLGTCNDIETVLKTKLKRDINRKVVDEDTLFEEAKNPKSKLAHIVRQFGSLMEIRVRQKAFHPNGEQKVLMLSPDVFSVLRIAPDSSEHILTLVNVTNRIGRIEIPLSELEVEKPYWYDLVGKRGWKATGDKLNVTLQPYDVVWLIPFIELEKMIES